MDALEKIGNREIVKRKYDEIGKKARENAAAFISAYKIEQVGKDVKQELIEACY